MENINNPLLKDINKEVGPVSSPTLSAEEDAGGACGVGSVSVGIGQGQSLISSPVFKKRADESYYNEGFYDEDQELALQILADEGKDISSFTTPDNSPEQMFELGKAVEAGIPEDKLKMMANPSISFMSLQVIIRAWKLKIDLTKYLPWADPFVLNQALLGAKKGLDLDKFIKPGLGYRQVEQLRKELGSGGNPEELSGNYAEIRAKRFPESNISNMRPTLNKKKISNRG